MVLCQRQNPPIEICNNHSLSCFQEWEVPFTIICGEQMPLQQEQVLEKEWPGGQISANANHLGWYDVVYTQDVKQNFSCILIITTEHRRIILMFL